MMQQKRSAPVLTKSVAGMMTILTVLVVTAGATPFNPLPNLQALNSAHVHTRNIDTMPPTTLPNGATNPFFPCGVTNSSINACPYRCWDNSIPGLPVLIDQCYSASEAASAISNSSAICVACRVPLPCEIPTSAADNNTCQPVASYLNSTSEMTPSRCGTPKHPIPACNWNCAEEQTPFTTCSATNRTATGVECFECTEMCSSPVLVFNPPQAAHNFSLSTGSCNSSAPVRAACPYRCTDDGDENNAYCSFHNITNDPFTTCKAC